MNRVVKHQEENAKSNLLGWCEPVLCEYCVFHIPVDKDIERVLRIWYLTGHGIENSCRMSKAYIGDTAKACNIKCVPISILKDVISSGSGICMPVSVPLLMLRLNLDTFTTLVRTRVASPGICLESSCGKSQNGIDIHVRCHLDTFIIFHWSWQTCVILIGMTRIYRWPSRPRRRIPVLLHQTCCSVQMTCAQWRFIGMWSSIIRNTGGWRSLSQTVTYQETTHCGIWWPSTQILQISPSHSASATNLSILTAHQLVSF